VDVRVLSTGLILKRRPHPGNRIIGDADKVQDGNRWIEA